MSTQLKLVTVPLWGAATVPSRNWRHPGGPPISLSASYWRTLMSYSLSTESPPKTKAAVTQFAPSVSTITLRNQKIHWISFILGSHNKDFLCLNHPVYNYFLLFQVFSIIEKRDLFKIIYRGSPDNTASISMVPGLTQIFLKGNSTDFSI